MLFDLQPDPPKKEEPSRPVIPKDFPNNFEIGFLFNFVSGKSTRFDLEPVVIFVNTDGKTEYRRISLNAEKGLAFLHMLDDEFYKQVLAFSDNKLLAWMTMTGNRFIRNHSGSWAHTSVRELQNLRKHYIDLLRPLWPKLQQWPAIFVLKSNKFNNFQQMSIRLGSEVRFSFRAEQQGSLILLKLNVFLDGKQADVTVRCGFLLESDNALYLPTDHEALAIIDQFNNEILSFPASIKKEIVSKYLMPWVAKYEVDIRPNLKVDVISPEPKARILLSELNESNLMIRPQFHYGDTVMDYSDEPSFVEEAGDKLRIVNRDKEHERQHFEYLRTLHTSFSNQRNNPYYYLPFDQVMKKGWFITMLRKVQDQGYTIHGWEDLKKFRYTTHDPRFTINAASTEEGFDLQVQIHWGDQEVSLKEVRHAILHGQDTIMLEDGTLGHIPDEWISQYSLLLRTASEEEGTLKISKIHYMLLEDILDKIDDKTVRQDIEARKNKLLQFDQLEKKPLSSEIKASLRPYQESGFNWLQSLDDLGWGGCLADDMGLGKTLQTISFLQFLKEKYPGSTQLVICPTSLIFNWESEMTKFCPTLKFHIHYGTQREFSETHFNDYDVVLTSYGVVRNDIEELNNFLWQYIILDESQAIKNPDARVTKAMQQLRSVNKLILSGTPVQNNTSDLFSQFNFVNPGLLGSREYFNREFATPIDKLGSKEKTLQLKKLVHPFTLRRTKEQVAKDLPDKTITVLWCTMDAEQRKLYNQYRDGYRKKLLKKIDEEGLTKSGMDVLEGLLRLRQICDHPKLVNKTEDGELSSVKVDELIREVQENAGNHKLLIFSQFTEMLGLIRNEFEKSGINYCYLDGKISLNKRKEEVNRFQEDESVKAFLISLKAGGVGLNLTVADYVYIVDPWWNPAAEMQAIDRAHRIGQTRKVFAYKMICKDTVEERILQMQQKKKMLADDLIQEDAGFVKNLSRDDIEFLFG
jgi:SNF2 family DNA or RNA helicase